MYISSVREPWPEFRSGVRPRRVDYAHSIHEAVSISMRGDDVKRCVLRQKAGRKKKKGSKGWCDYSFSLLEFFSSKDHMSFFLDREDDTTITDCVVRCIHWLSSYLFLNPVYDAEAQFYQRIPEGY